MKVARVTVSAISHGLARGCQTAASMDAVFGAASLATGYLSVRAADTRLAFRRQINYKYTYMYVSGKGQNAESATAG